MLRSWSVRAEVTDLNELPALIRAHVLACDCTLDPAGAAGHDDTRIDKAAFGAVTAFRYTIRGTHTARRKHGHIATDPSDDLLLYLPLSSGYSLSQGGRAIELHPGTASFARLDQPFVASFVGARRGASSAANVRISRSAVRRRFPRIDDCLVQALSLRHGAGRILLTLLRCSIAESEYLDDDVAGVLGESLLDCIGAAAAQQWGGQTEAAAPRGRLRERLLVVLRANLSNPCLDPALLAETCGISLRAVHYAFADGGTTVAATIREQRLLRCRADLRDPSLTGRTVASIAYSWGFKDVAHFAHAYRARFNISPGRDRSPRDRPR
jgi:AraC-like DNA-binding protein